MKNPSASNPEDDFDVKQSVPPAVPKQPKAPTSAPAQSLKQFAPIGLPKPNLPRVRLKQTHDDDEGVDIKVPVIRELQEENLPEDLPTLFALKQRYEDALPDRNRRQKLVKDRQMAAVRAKWFRKQQGPQTLASVPVTNRNAALVAKLSKLQTAQ